MNRRNGERVLAGKLGYNFRDGDYHMVYTHRGDPPGAPEAMKSNAAYLKKLKKLYKAAGAELKYITVPGYGRKTGRIHHHTVINRAPGVGIDEIMALWKHGKVLDGRLDTGGDYRALAKYLYKHGDIENPVSKRRYSTSQNVKSPPAYRDEIELGEIGGPAGGDAWALLGIKASRGCEIDEESVFEGHNPMTGRVYVEYVEKPKKGGARPRRKKGQARARPRDLGFARWLRENGLEQMEMDI
jgi:hypothetical protein